jgi:hypothetical protein
MKPEEINAKIAEKTMQFVSDIRGILAESGSRGPISPSSNAEQTPGYVPPVEPDIEFYETDGRPYDCTLGHSWMYRDPVTGDWYAGNFSLDHHGHGSAIIEHPEEMMEQEYYAWMKNPGKGTLNIFRDPEFLKQLEKGWNE